MPKKKAKATRPSAAKPFPADTLEIDFVILADAAQVKGGKLYMLGGGWNIFRPPEKYPIDFPFAVAVGILVPWAETNREHSFNFVIQASEGAVLGKGEGRFEVGREVGLKAGMKQRFTLAISGGLHAEGPGTFEVIVTIPGDEKRVTFELFPTAAKGH